MPDATRRGCAECGSTTNVRTYDDPETDAPVDLCEACARALYEDVEDVTTGLVPADDDPDSTFADTCITAADYYREGDY